MGGGGGEGGGVIKEFVGLKVKTYSYLKDNNDEYKKAKETKSFVIKRKLKFEYYKKLFRSSSNREKNTLFKKKQTDVDSLREDQKEFIKNNQLI